MRKCPVCGKHMNTKRMPEKESRKAEYICTCGYREFAGLKEIREKQNICATGMSGRKDLNRQNYFTAPCPKCGTQMVSFEETLYGVRKIIYVCANCNYSVSAGITTNA